MANSFFVGPYRRGETDHEAKFSCSLQELHSLMDQRGAEVVTKNEESYGDVKDCVPD
ncbi:hypothetical protein ABVT39_005700 [Epinephelus coioides]